MKTQILILAAVIFSLFSCQNQETNQTNVNDEAESTSEVSEKSKQSDKQVAKTEKNSNYIIAEGKVGHLNIETDEIRLNPGEKLIHETRMMSEEGMDFEAEFDHILNQDNDTLITIDNYGYWIFSPKYHTESGLHVNKSMADFYGLYADAKLFYSYVSGIFWMASESLEGVEFAIENSAYKGESDWLMESDLVEVEPQHMDESAKITKIRVY